MKMIVPGGCIEPRMLVANTCYDARAGKHEKILHSNFVVNNKRCAITILQVRLKAFVIKRRF